MALLVKMDQFSGKDNVADSVRAQAVVRDNWSRVYPLKIAKNIYVDDSGALQTRPGYAKVLSGRSAPHSFWSDGSQAYFAEGSVLYRFHSDYTVTSVFSALATGSRVCYCPVNDRVYLSDATTIGYLKSQAFNYLADPSTLYKRPLPAGRCLAFYRGRIYVAANNVLYISDPLSDFFDTRTGFRTFEADIEMVLAVDSGLYVGADKTYFLAGLSPEEFQRAEVSDDRPVYGTGATKKHNGKIVAMWTTKNGIYAGNEGGTVRNVTDGRYRPGDYSMGSASFLRTSGVDHYQASLY